MAGRRAHVEAADHACKLQHGDGNHSLYTPSCGIRRPESKKLTDSVPLLLLLLLLPLLAATPSQAFPQDQLLNLYYVHLQHNLVSILTCFALLVFVAIVYVMSRSPSIYLVDYACVKPPPELMVPYSLFRGHSEKSGCFDAQSLDFQRKILERSGLGEQTYLPHAMHVVPARPTMSAARAEAEDVMFGALTSLFDSTGIKPKDIGILIVNCSIFNPTPSLSAMIVDKYKLRGNIRSYTLSGMGCSAGIISIDLAKKLLQVHRNTYALVISMENITQNWYFGNCKSMLIPNCLFRIGGAAILLSNKRKERETAKYQLLHTVRTHKGADDKAFYCVYQQEDEKGGRGVSLSKDLMVIAGNALTTNITTLGPLVLPLSEQLLFLTTLVARKVLNMKIKSYIPNFKLAFEHFCIHAGGRAVIDELEKNLQLSPRHVEASRMTLHRFGNTSSSSIWYELAYIEAKGRVQKGDRIWQIAFGSGFKCNSAVWSALRSGRLHADSPWADCIDQYPVIIPDVVST